MSARETLFPRHALAAAICSGLGLAAALPAQADGTFVQFDFSDAATSAVAVAVRGDISYGLSRNEYEGGHDWTASVLYRMQFGAKNPIGLQVGPAVRIDEEHKTLGGLRATVDHYHPTGWGHVYLLADYTTIRNSHFAMVQLGHRASGLGLELAAMGDDEDYQEETITATYRFGQSPFSLRLGQKLEAQETFIGFSINTF